MYCEGKPINLIESINTGGFGDSKRSRNPQNPDCVMNDDEFTL